MALTTAGAVLLAKCATGLNTPTLYSASNAALGVGDSATAYGAAQTDLQAATNKSRVLVTSIAESSGVVTAVATWGTSVGNYEWVEWGLFNSGAAQSGGTMLGRKVESPTLGTKTSAQVWSLTATITFAAA
jgi:hypothetical protein